MTQLAIQLDPDSRARLERRALKNGHTVEEEAAKIIADEVTGLVRPADPVEWSRRIRAMSPHDVQQTDSLELIREGRNR
jgi:hypothetical protein